MHLDVDVQGYRPGRGETDKHGYAIDDRLYNEKDFDRTLVIDERTRRVAKWVSDYLKQSGDRFQKTIVFCVDAPSTRPACAKRWSTRTPTSSNRTPAT